MADGVEPDVKMIKAMLASMGVENYEPPVVQQFLEVYYVTAMDLIMDAQTYSSHADKPSIDEADVKLATECRNCVSSTQTLSLEVIKESAMKKNTTAVPWTPAEGIPLPPLKDMLISSKDIVEIQKKRSNETVEEQNEGKDVLEYSFKPPREREASFLPENRERVSFPLRSLYPR